VIILNKKKSNFLMYDYIYVYIYMIMLSFSNHVHVNVLKNIIINNY